MHAIQVEEPGDADALVWREDPGAPIGPADVFVDVHAAGVNYIDTYHRSGLYSMPLPMVPGLEGSGVISAVGSDVTHLGPGDRVAWATAMGSYRQRHVVPASQVLAVPDDIDLDIAAALPLQGMTAHYLAVSTYPLGRGDICLIHAAAGGTGRLLVQIAKRRGATVVATVGSPEKADLARLAGADHVIDYTITDVAQGVHAAVGHQAVDVVYDGVGAATFDASLEVLRPRGTMVSFGNASGAVPPVAPLQLMPKSLFLTRPSLAAYIADPRELKQRWDDLCRWYREGAFEIRIGATVPMAEAADAHRLLEGRQLAGKILLRA